MKNPKKTLVYLFLIYLILQFVMALYIDARQDDLGFLLSIKTYLPWMKYISLVGLVLFLFAYIAVIRDTRQLRKAVNEAKEEHTTLKAKLFDLQEAARKSSDATSLKAADKTEKAELPESRETRENAGDTSVEGEADGEEEEENKNLKDPE